MSPTPSTEAAIEAVLVVAVEPVPPGLLAELLEMPVDTVEAYCRQLQSSTSMTSGASASPGSPAATGCRATRRALNTSSASCSTARRRSSPRRRSRRLPSSPTSNRSPAHRSSAIRGVNADGVLRLLTARGYVQAIGRDSGPGQPVLFGTTELFLERLGLDSLAELPALAGFVPPASTVEMLETALRPEPEG